MRVSFPSRFGALSFRFSNKGNVTKHPLGTPDGYTPGLICFLDCLMAQDIACPCQMVCHHRWPEKKACISRLRSKHLCKRTSCRLMTVRAGFRSSKDVVTYSRVLSLSWTWSPSGAPRRTMVATPLWLYWCAHTCWSLCFHQELRKLADVLAALWAIMEACFGGSS